MQAARDERTVAFAAIVQLERVGLIGYGVPVGAATRQARNALFRIDV